MNNDIYAQIKEKPEYAYYGASGKAAHKRC